MTFVSSGAAAVTYAVTALALSGDNIVAANNLCGGTVNLFEHTLLKNYGITTTWVDPKDPANFEKAITDFDRIFSPVLAEEVKNGFLRLKPLYRYLLNLQPGED